MADTNTHKFGIISNGVSATGLVVQSCNKDENVESRKPAMRADRLRNSKRIQKEQPTASPDLSRMVRAKQL